MLSMRFIYVFTGRVRLLIHVSMGGGSNRALSWSAGTAQVGQQAPNRKSSPGFMPIEVLAAFNIAKLDIKGH